MELNLPGKKTRVNMLEMQGHTLKIVFYFKSFQYRKASDGPQSPLNLLLFHHIFVKKVHDMRKSI